MNNKEEENDITKSDKQIKPMIDSQNSSQSKLYPQQISNDTHIQSIEKKQTENDSTTTPTNRQQNGRWKWDGTAWRWRTDLKPKKQAIRPLLTKTCLLTNSTQVQPSFLSITPTNSIPPYPHIPLIQSTSHPPSQQQLISSKTTPKRTAAGQVWVDNTLIDWPEDDHRIFVGDLAPDATDSQLVNAFSKYPSFNMARVVKDKRTGVCRGYGFVSFARGEDMVAALSQMNGKYVGGRPVKLKRSNWKKRTLTTEKRRELKAFRTISKK